MHKGQRYISGLGMRFRVNKVAHDDSWVDVTVTDPVGNSWPKRQRLVRGEFPFAVELVEEPAEVVG